MGLAVGDQSADALGDGLQGAAAGSFPHHLQRGGPAPAAAGADPVFAFSCVFRAGRAGASTDHNSILFDVDQQKRCMGVGTSNMHWYQLGFPKALATPWLNNSRFTHHPDGHIPVTGKAIPELDSMLKVREPQPLLS